MDISTDTDKPSQFVKVVDKDGKLVMYATTFFPYKERNSKSFKKEQKRLKSGEDRLFIFHYRTSAINK